MGPKKNKSPQDNKDWLMLRHPGIFEKIMLMIGLDCLKSLDNCRQVCKTWNAMIMNNIWENPTKEWGTIIQRRIEKSWDNQVYTYYWFYHYPSDEKISRAKLLGKHRLTILLIVQISMYCFSDQRYPHP